MASLLGARREPAWYIPTVCGVLGLLFLVVPIIEIYFIVKVGALLGIWPTVLIIGVTAMVGAALAKTQGFAVLQNLQESLRKAEGTGVAIVEGVLVLAAGMTLLAPGFLTDAVGLSLLVPPIRTFVATRLAASWKVTSVIKTTSHDNSDDPPPGVIDV